MGALNSKSKCKDFYKVKSRLARGTFGTVYKAYRKKDKKPVAIKKIIKKNLTKEDIEATKREVKIMTKVNHVGCVRFLEVFETDKKYYIVMELLEGGELFDRIVERGQFSEKEASLVFRQLIEAVAYLHSIGIVHRDIKPSNVMYETSDPNSPVKLVDFGLAAERIDGVLLREPCGTPDYAAPELLAEKGYDEMVDLWSLGVLLFVVLSGSLPFPDKDHKVKFKKIRKGEYKFKDKYWKNISESAKELVRGLMTVEPRKRMTVEQCLQHPWVTGVTARSRAFTSTFPDRLKQHVKPKPEGKDAVKEEIEPGDDSVSSLASSISVIRSPAHSRNSSLDSSAAKAPYVTNSPQSASSVHRRTPSREQPPGISLSPSSSGRRSAELRADREGKGHSPNLRVDSIREDVEEEGGREDGAIIGVARSLLHDLEYSSLRASQSTFQSPSQAASLSVFSQLGPGHDDAASSLLLTAPSSPVASASSPLSMPGPAVPSASSSPAPVSPPPPTPSASASSSSAASSAAAGAAPSGAEPASSDFSEADFIVSSYPIESPSAASPA